MDGELFGRKVAFALALFLSAPLLSGCRPIKDLSGLIHLNHHELGPGADVCADPTVATLARDLDNLEAHIERYGSVVAKQPDVWGQARLTKHRQEFEAQLVAQLNAFDYTLQGTISQSDQAYFTDALALSAAATPPARGSSTTTSTTTVNAAPTSTTPASSSGSSSSSSSGSSSSSTVPLPTPTDLSAPFNSMSRTGVTTPLNVPFSGVTTGLTIEPTVLLDERARFINHLQELRRINEGDDTADSPGYALNLVRIPVSVLPGKFTRVGFGAEITITMNPYLSDELLPTTFRNLIINDLTEQLGFPITEFINNPENTPYFDENGAEDIDQLLAFLQYHAIGDFTSQSKLVAMLVSLRWMPGLQTLLARPEWHWLVEFAKEHSPNQSSEQSHQHRVRQAEFIPEPLPAMTPPGQNGIDVETDSKKQLLVQQQQLEIEIRKRQSLRNSMRAHEARGNIPVPSTKSRQAKLPFPPSEIFDVYGYDFERLTVDAYRGLAKERFSRPTTASGPVFFHLPDVQGYLQEELNAAYKFLQHAETLDLWNFCEPHLAAVIRAHDLESLECVRLKFKQSLHAKKIPVTSTTAALSWAIIVESALLTDQLVQDIRESAAAKGCACNVPGYETLPYFLPNPPAEARQAFNQYVRCRWPIHVFALDPATQEQNIASTFSGRREMQLAMSMAFVGGNLSANNMMRYARRIEYDLATVDLNSTDIGFSHGDDTFGWRFYPRFQTPDIESNATVFFRDLLVGGPNKDALLQMRRLEPGIRECYAVVIMPSFVPYATFNVSANWFKLRNPHCKELDATDAMRLSKLAKNIQVCSTRVADGDCYRDGDFMRLLEKAKQLETRLPFQNTMVQIPYENTLGGFAMFNTGITDLAPELTGFYGTEAIDTTQNNTVFLVGNHFSVHQTTVIAGGQTAGVATLLSRQVAQITIPSNPQLIGDKNQQFVDVQLATPYGISQHLLIPTIPQASGTSSSGAGTSANVPSWQPNSVDVAFTYSGLGIAPAGATPGSRPTNVNLQPGLIDTGTYDLVDVTLKFKQPKGQATITNVAYDATSQAYVIPSSSIATAVFSALSTGFGPQATNPAVNAAATASLTFHSSTNAAAPQTVTAGNSLTINFIQVTSAKSPSGP